jgi:hypothetical protein
VTVLESKIQVLTDRDFLLEKKDEHSAHGLQKGEGHEAADSTDSKTTAKKEKAKK